jgi:hypothetical protein
MAIKSMAVGRLSKSKQTTSDVRRVWPVPAQREGTPMKTDPGELIIAFVSPAGRDRKAVLEALRSMGGMKAVGVYQPKTKTVARLEYAASDKNDTSTAAETSTKSRTKTSTSTSTDAYTSGNVTVTGGAGNGATTSVTINTNNYCSCKKDKEPGKDDPKAKKAKDEIDRAGDND